MNPRDILKNLENETIEDIELSKIDISELEINRLKNNVSKKIKKGRNIKRTVMTAAIAVALIGTISTPTIAANIPILNDVYRQLGIFSGYEEYTNYIGESKESNGFKVTIENIIATPNLLEAVVKVESSEALKRNPKEDNFYISVKMGDSKLGRAGSSGSQPYYIDDHTVILNYKEKLEGDKFPKLGELKIDIQKRTPELEAMDLDLSFKANIDFTSAFKNNYDININKQVNKKFELKKLEANAMGSELKFSGEDTSYLYDPWGPRYYLEVDGKIYAQTLGNNMDFPQLTANVLRNANSINCIISDTENEIKWQVYSDNVTIENIQSNNIKYPKTITSQNGLKGEFYNIEWEGDTLKFYFRSEYEALPIFNELALSVSNNEEDKDFSRYTNKYTIVKTEEGYVAQFSDVDRNNYIELIYNNFGLPLDNFKEPQVIKIK